MTGRPLVRLLAAALVLALPAGAAAQGSPTGMPTQAQTDGATIGSQTQAGWAAMADGVAGRPYVARLTMTDGGVETVLIDGGTTTPPATTPGQATAVVSPYNLCAPGQTPAQGQCYATPNRIAITIAKTAGDVVDQNLTGAATTDTVFDMTVGLNSLGQSLRWSWANLDLLYWSTSGLGTPEAQFRIRFRPVTTPYISDWSGNYGCTQTPIGQAGPCDPQQSAAEILAASITLSLDDTVNPALTGAIFATQGAIFGYLNPTGTAVAPVLDLQIASAHLRPDGSAQTGRMQALLPAQSLINIYGVLPADATTFFATTRAGAGGTNAPPGYAVWSAGTEGSDGLLITVDGITFSAPTYKITRKVKAAKTAVSTKGGRTTITVRGVNPGCRKAACTATLYSTASAVSGKARRLATVGSGADGSVVVSAPSAMLKRGTSWSLTVRKRASGKLVSTAAGVI
ncbi:MAG: hypothetical protein ACKO2Y_08090, partial [Actinomycetota bacterium]